MLKPFKAEIGRREVIQFFTTDIIKKNPKEIWKQYKFL